MEGIHDGDISLNKAVEEAKASIEKSKKKIYERAEEIKKRITNLEREKDRVVKERMELLKAKQLENQKKIWGIIEKRKSLKQAIEKVKHYTISCY